MYLSRDHIWDTPLPARGVRPQRRAALSRTQSTLGTLGCWKPQLTRTVVPPLWASDDTALWSGAIWQGRLSRDQPLALFRRGTLGQDQGYAGGEKQRDWGRAVPKIRFSRGEVGPGQRVPESKPRPWPLSHRETGHRLVVAERV